MNTTNAPVAVAYVYDRRIDQKADTLKVRINACLVYLQATRMQIGGLFVDTGADAMSLDRRPRLDDLLEKMRADAAPQPVCLVYEFERFALDRDVRDALMRRVLDAGGSVQTLRGQRLSPGGAISSAPRGGAA